MATVADKILLYKTTPLKKVNTKLYFKENYEKSKRVCYAHLK